MKSLSLQEANGRRGRGANRPSGSVGGGVPSSLARRATEKMRAAHELDVDDVDDNDNHALGLCMLYIGKASLISLCC